MLDGEDEMSAGDQRAVDMRQELAQALDIVERKRAVDQVERSRGELEVLHIGADISNRRIGRVDPGARQHVLGNIDAANLGRSLLSRPVAKPAEAAAEVEDLAPAQ